MAEKPQPGRLAAVPSLNPFVAARARKAAAALGSNLAVTRLLDEDPMMVDLIIAVEESAHPYLDALKDCEFVLLACGERYRTKVAHVEKDVDPKQPVTVILHAVDLGKLDPILDVHAVEVLAEGAPPREIRNRYYAPPRRG